MPRKMCGSLKRKQRKLNKEYSTDQSLSSSQKKEMSASEARGQILDSSTSSVSEVSAPDSSTRPQPVGETSVLPEKQLSTSVAIQASPHDAFNSTLETIDDAYSTADEDDGFQVYYSKKRRAYFYNGGHNKVGPVGKVAIISPRDGMTQVKLLDALRVSKELQALVPEGISKVRLNLRLNLLAVDTNTIEATGRLLTLKRLCGVPVQVREPHGSYGTVGVIYNIPPGATESQIEASIRSKAPVVSVRIPRPPSPAVVTFASPQLPDYVLIGLVQHKVHQHIDRPPRCHRCGRIGHVDVVCCSPPSCRRCGGPHARAACVSPRQTCVNCGQGHDSCSNACPKWMEALRICRYRNAHKVDYSTAKAAVVGTRMGNIGGGGGGKILGKRNDPDPGLSQLPQVRNADRALKHADVDIFPRLVAFTRSHVGSNQHCQSAVPTVKRENYSDVYIPDQGTAIPELALEPACQLNNEAEQKRKMSAFSHIIGKVIQGLLFLCQKLF